MKTQPHEAELVAEAVTFYRNWREAAREVINRPSPERKHWERECYAIWDQYPKAVQDEAQICVSRGSR